MKYKIIAVLFKGEDHDKDGKCDADTWNLLEKGFVKSINQNTKGTLKLIRITPPAKREGCNYIFSSLMEKTKVWAEEIQKLRSNAVICDVDIIFKKDVREVFKKDFDVAITKRDHEAWFNSGVMFVKPTPGARKLFKLWKEKTEEIYNSKPAENGVPEKVIQARKNTKQKHFNQPAFVELMEQGAFDGIKILQLPCDIYNLCNTTWENYTPNTKIVHLNPKLRDAVLFNKVNKTNKRKWGKLIRVCQPYYI